MTSYQIATASAGNATASIQMKRPSWKDVYEGYPKDSMGDDLPAPEVFTSILGPNYDKNTFGNACATRVSLGLLNGGVNVRKLFLISRGKHKGKGFIASAKALKDWLSKKHVWGEAEFNSKGATTIDEVRKEINGRQGIYIIVGGFGSGISGHATLWVNDINGGDVIGGHNYIDYGGTVYFWELK